MKNKTAYGGSFAKKTLTNGFFEKEATDLGRKKLIDEIHFLQKLPKELADYFPILIDHFISDEKVSLKEENINQPHLRKLLFDNVISAKDAITVFDSILDMFSKHGYNKEEIITPPDYLNDYHFERVKKRIDYTVKHVPFFRSLIVSKFIRLNNKKLINVPHVLHFIQKTKELKTFLTPKTVYPYVHGDLHPQNILVNPQNLSFKLVDPRGYAYCTIYYDLGKIGHSFNGKYDFIHEKLFTISWEKINEDEINVNLRFKQNKAYIEYEKVNKNIEPLYKKYANDEYALLHAYFNEAMHLASDMPFHLEKNKTEEKAIALYVQGVRALNQFLELYDKTFKTNFLKQLLLSTRDKETPIEINEEKNLITSFL